MKNEISVFNYDKNKVRTIIRNGELWFVLKDVCEILGRLLCRIDWRMMR